MSTAVVETLDIGSKGGYPASDLSNFKGRTFVFDGFDCGSMEGLLQAFKFKQTHLQREVCKLVGIVAKHKGKERNNWQNRQNRQVLWWYDCEYDRHSDDYQHLLDRAYLELARQCPDFREALLATGTKSLTHRLGRTKAFETILTQSEFCNRLMKLRALLVKDDDLSKVSRL